MLAVLATVILTLGVIPNNEAYLYAVHEKFL
jgi:hypothetical protein